MTRAELDVFIAGEHAGVLSQEDSGALSYRYLRGYRGVSLSSAMPLSTREYRDKTILPYLWGLLPEDIATRKRVAAEANISYNNPFDLLSVIGLDCPGAVQFCKQGEKGMREERLIPISESDIAHRLSQARNDNSGWIAANEHWSLGGQQSKFALRKQNNEWFVCEGAAATTHIFKSGVRNLSHQALNEYVCMQVARECEIDVAKTEYREFEGERGIEPAIVIARYDRVVSGKNVTRLHQEDFCQALGCLPDNKYTMYGGPGTADILKFLISTGSAAQTNVASFLQMLFFNYLFAVTDAHAKNYSLLLNPNGSHRLAPMYDVASIAPYIEPGQWKNKPPKLAMSIGEENRIGYLSSRHLSKMMEQCESENVNITADGCVNLIVHYAEIIPKKLAAVFDALEKTNAAPASKELRERMEKPIVRLCAKTIERL